MRADPGEWTPGNLRFSYGWQADGRPIPDQSGRVLRLETDELRARITVVVTATDSTGASVSAVSEKSSKVAKAQLSVDARPKVNGVARFTRTVRAISPEFSKRATVSYRWLRDDVPISGARGQRHRLGVADVGHEVRVRATARRDGYRTVRVQSPARKVGHLRPTRKVFTYSVATRGPVNADLGVFRTQAQQTFDDPRGWRAAGVGFRRVAEGGDFTLVLATAATVPSFSSACSSQWSCRVGRFVIINQTRWQTASPAWNSAGRSLRDYRHLVVNHETGHWLGHGHRGCAGSGPAPVMMQQSKGTGGCSFNPWPVASERWTSR